jgi:AAA domain
VVLVGDDRQLAAIDAGGGFRALRLRLGASELTENRRQHQAWEREALELVRSGLIEEAVVAYRAHDRVVAADSKPAATLALLQDWWAAFQQAERDPSQEIIVLAARRAEVDRLNTPVVAARGLPSMPRALPAVLWGPSGSPAWPTRPGSTSTPLPNRQGPWVLNWYSRSLVPALAIDLPIEGILATSSTSTVGRRPGALERVSMSRTAMRLG